MNKEEIFSQYCDKIFVYFRDKVRSTEKLLVSDMSNEPEKFIKTIKYLIDGDWFNYPGMPYIIFTNDYKHIIKEKEYSLFFKSKKIITNERIK